MIDSPRLGVDELRTARCIREAESLQGGFDSPRQNKRNRGGSVVAVDPIALGNS